MKTTRILAILGLAMLVTSAAQARFIMFDANFDSRPVGSSLDRRGARYGEPVEAAGDNHSEVVVADGPGDRSVQIWDTTTSGPDALTFALLDGREISDGKVHVSLELQPDTVDVYSVGVDGPDTATQRFFSLVLDAAGFVYWSDHDDIAVTQFSTYGAADVLQIDLTFNLNDGTYDFTLNGTPILTGESFGTPSFGIANVVVGNQLDGNATGSVRMDDLSVDWAPGTATPLLSANFNDEALGQPIGFGGAAVGEPISANACTPIVVNGVFPTRSLQIDDASTTTASWTTFEFLDSAEAMGDVSISFWVEFDSLERYEFVVHEQGSNTENFLVMNFVADGRLWFDDAASGNSHYHMETYAANTPVHFEIAFYSELGLYSIWMDGVRVVHRRGHGITGRGIGRLNFGESFDTDLNGRMNVDRIQVDTLDSPLTGVQGDPTPQLAAIPLAAAPNPFNPATALRFSLPQAADVRLDVIDLRGRRVAHLVNGSLAAGDHEATWHGYDTAGRPAASGVYEAILRVGGQVRQRLALTLVK